MEINKFLEIFINLCTTRVELEAKSKLSKQEKLIVKWMDNVLASINEHVVLEYLKIVQAFNNECKANGTIPSIDINGAYISKLNRDVRPVVDVEEGLAMAAGVLAANIPQHVALSEDELDSLGF